MDGESWLGERLAMFEEKPLVSKAVWGSLVFAGLALGRLPNLFPDRLGYIHWELFLAGVLVSLVGISLFNRHVGVLLLLICALLALGSALTLTLGA